ncbi:hypothetical protein [Actinotalea sp. JY-7876]|uniref:hypothetical protein n=1 Tax=Actinotalea sp. JY-7876 TaxID=2758442 RepID=UPI0015F68D3A|nr:hypothetical protein [Actinotalea sp. JY-7876]
MTSSGTDPRDPAAGGRPPAWPFGEVRAQEGAPPAGRAGGAAGEDRDASPARRSPAPEPEPAAGRPERRTPPVWLLVLGALVLVGAVVGGVLLLGDRGGDPAVAPEPETVTLPLPTPTVEPVARAAGTAFSDALPSTVLAYALSELAEDPAGLQAGAVEAYRLAYTDGAASVVLLAAQWETPEEASAAYAVAVEAQTAAAAQAGAGDGAEEGSEDEASTDTEEGAVTTTDGAEAGRYTIVPRGDGTATLTWWNGTAVLQLDGPTDDVRDLFAAFPL